MVFWKGLKLVNSHAMTACVTQEKDHSASALS